MRYLKPSALKNVGGCKHGNGVVLTTKALTRLLWLATAIAIHNPPTSFSFGGGRGFPLATPDGPSASGGDGAFQPSTLFPMAASVDEAFQLINLIAKSVKEVDNMAIPNRLRVDDHTPLIIISRNKGELMASPIFKEGDDGTPITQTLLTVLYYDRETDSDLLLGYYDDATDSCTNPFIVSSPSDDGVLHWPLPIFATVITNYVLRKFDHDKYHTHITIADDGLVYCMSICNGLWASLDFTIPRLNNGKVGKGVASTIILTLSIGYDNENMTYYDQKDYPILSIADVLKAMDDFDRVLGQMNTGKFFGGI